MPQLSVTPNPNVKFEILRETQGYLAVAKPAGIATQPGIKHTRDSLLNGLFCQFGSELQNLGKKRDYGLLHRLDLAVSGVLLVGRTIESYDYLRSLFVERAIQKRYLCLVHGEMKGSGHISLPIREVRIQGQKTAQLGVHPLAKQALTSYEVLGTSGGISLVECSIKTGRLHQIRVHLASAGHPVIGDFTYGRRTSRDRALGRNRIALHAASIAFRPFKGSKRIYVESSLPPDILKLAHQSGLRVVP